MTKQYICFHIIFNKKLIFQLILSKNRLGSGLTTDLTLFQFMTYLVLFSPSSWRKKASLRLIATVKIHLFSKRSEAYALCQDPHVQLFCKFKRRSRSAAFCLQHQTKTRNAQIFAHRAHANYIFHAKTPQCLVHFAHKFNRTLLDSSNLNTHFYIVGPFDFIFVLLLITIRLPIDRLKTKNLIILSRSERRICTFISI